MTISRSKRGAMSIRLLDPSKGHRIQELESTNEWIKSSDHEAGSWVVSEYQTKGKGRNGKIWTVLGDDKIIFSGKIRFGLTSLPLPLVSLFSGASILKALHQWFPEHAHETKIKWPNDIYRKNKKIAGILIETEILENQFTVIIGLGLNIYGNNIPTELENIAGFATDASPLEGTSERILFTFIEKINESILNLMEPTLVSKELQWIEKNSTLIGKIIECNIENSTIRGKAVGYDENGFLIIISESGMKHILLDSDSSFKVWDEINE
ncbi:biotin--[acetyl-CoA-carboxylase] ligase [Leptospira sp. GIMC2001]|uniref:biotin--[acetyl-CoA-carboxylase] ligase n=1 Tax=Leptospira sp. GIMC2001 TaxID=1513297 RepID=UPI002348FD30|nr:biotin--[acetyl-CoA-carboxylase] ligase [Leptospira sp. GIMC2001]WCL49584.1 biotin--[acetyl-CoA-carboxylase] ligase [Leptospira sp. GIMC2001]